MTDVWTAQYRYSGSDRLDITVKGQDPKGGSYSEKQYTIDYITILGHRQNSDHWAFEEILSKDSITLVCFCPSGNFCHRHLLARFIEHCYEDAVLYEGERRI
jgi:uncharacterized protein YeaO (DUF488 family)